MQGRPSVTAITQFHLWGDRIRAFCRRLIDCTLSVHQSHRHIQVTVTMKTDLSAWLEFVSLQ